MSDQHESSGNYKNKSSFYGLIYGVFSSLLLYLSYKFGFQNATVMSFLSLAVAVAIVFYPIYLYKLENDNLLKLGEALKIGLIVGLVGGLIYAVYTYLHYKSIDTEFVTKALKESQKAIQENTQGLSEEELEQASQMTSMMVSPFTFATINLFTLLFNSFIIALVVGLIKKNN